ncbi:MAG: RHS repeat-associated core domain-containing protein, partial [Planctomycetaceae bacterium]|nr:RHS repeat-associated core domain-containing protein [Planctomycetaceae bacterium]
RVEYDYASGADNTIRPTLLTYPNGRELTVDYGTAGGMDDQLSRVSALVDDDDTTLAAYSYLGLGSVVQQSSPEADLLYTLADLNGTDDPTTGDIYSGLDRFGRIKDCRWYNTNSESDLSRIQYGYNRASSRLWRQNDSDPNHEHDWLYSYDGLQRLKEAERGTLSSGHSSLDSGLFAQCWSLDATGNWEGFRQSDTGSAWSLVQDRTSNDVNEITNITESTGPAWSTPAYSAAGNMTTIPKTSDPTSTLAGTYDAWNRLVKVVEGSDTVAEYAYDGRSYRMVTKAYSGGSLDETRHAYYTNSWQLLEQRIDSETTPDRQFVWGVRYIDDLVLRDRTTSSTLDERLYALQDANWNVTAVVDDGGTVQERYEYDPYGITTVCSPSYTPRSGSDYAWETTYCGYRWEDAVGLYAVRYRWYSPRLATWVSRDPVGYAAGVNLYAYVNGMPTVYIDPWGLDQHHVFVQAESFLESFSSKCGDLFKSYGFTPEHFIDQFTVDVGRMKRGTDHHHIHYKLDKEAFGSDKYNENVKKLLNDSESCCDFLTGMLDLIQQVADDVHQRYHGKTGPAPFPTFKVYEKKTPPKTGLKDLINNILCGGGPPPDGARVCVSIRGELPVLVPANEASILQLQPKSMPTPPPVDLNPPWWAAAAAGVVWFAEGVATGVEYTAGAAIGILSIDVTSALRDPKRGA